MPSSQFISDAVCQQVIQKKGHLQFCWTVRWQEKSVLSKVQENILGFCLLCIVSLFAPHQEPSEQNLIQYN